MKKYFSILKSLLFLPQKVAHFPLHIQIDVTTYCNLKCIMCNSKKIISSKENNLHLTFEKFKHIVDSIKPVSVNLAASGEPFLNPEIFKMIDYAKEKAIATIISSNFILSQEIIKKVVTSKLAILKISVDGATKETYEKIRGNNYNILKENISLFNNLKLNLKKEEPKLRFDFVIMKHNYREIVEYISFAKQFGVTNIYFHPIDSREYDENKKNEIISNIDIVLLEKILREAKKVAKYNKIKTNLGSLLNNFDIIKKLYFSNNENHIKRKVCVLPWFGLFVSISGETSPCCSMYPDEKKSFGNIFNTDFENVWNGTKFINMRSECKKMNNYNKYKDCDMCLPMDISTIIDSMKTFPNYIEKYFRIKRDK